MAEINIDKMAKNVSEKALDEFLYQGKSIREWMQIIASEDCISRQASISKIRELFSLGDCFCDEHSIVGTLNGMPSVNPKESCGDAISKKEVLEMAYDMSEIDGEHFTEPCMVVDVEDIQKLPPVNPTETVTEFADRCRECGAKYGKLLKQEPCEDAVSRQAVLDAMYELCNTGETLEENPWRDNPHIDAITDVINDLPPVNPQETSGDLISRQAVLDYIYSDLGLGDEENGKDLERQMELERSYKYVKSLPPVNPQSKTDTWSIKDVADTLAKHGLIVEQEPKTGHWIMHEKHRECSECTVWLPKDMPRNSFCPNCGARMVETQESEK